MTHDSIEEAAREAERAPLLTVSNLTIKHRGAGSGGSAGAVAGAATILHEVNLDLHRGEVLGLIGESGAGKSTLADLIPRFHDATSGQLLIDGVNIKEYSLSSVRAQMGIVTQEPILFNDSIANNISLGSPGANIAEIETAAMVANAHQFIMQKDENYQTNIGDRGM